MTQSGLTGDNFTMFADKYAALQELPTAEQLSASASYCSVQFSNETGLLPCLCAGGGMAELTLNITDPTSDEFSTDPDTSTQLVLAVVEERLRATLGLWVADVAIDSVESGSANIHITFSTLSRMKIEQVRGHFATLAT
ncbi:hypothetical protein FJT64_016672 [Amphibalanus amphitrite]|uniref:Uncharacterized protein n=1 Tax=Amphibalanus amphitrite TaxID=1232801 RepID=A0A6A4X302_AMPAM|nr:hypothetical protein FJT64_016672 [Amphibalanus amphitrite]